MKHIFQRSFKAEKMEEFCFDAALFHKAEEPSIALSSISQMREHDKSLSKIRESAVRQYHQKNYDAALLICDENASATKDYEMQRLRVGCLIKLKDLRTALMVLAPMTKRNRCDADLLLMLSEVRFRLGLVKEAKESCVECLKLQSGLSQLRTWTLLAHVYARLQQPQLAEACFQAARALSERSYNMSNEWLKWKGSRNVALGTICATSHIEDSVFEDEEAWVIALSKRVTRDEYQPDPRGSTAQEDPKSL